MGASASILDKVTEEQRAEITAEIEKLKADGVAEEEIEKTLKEKYAEILAAAEAPPSTEVEAAPVVDAPSTDVEAAAPAATGGGLETKTIPLTDLQKEIDAAVAAGKTPLVVDNSEEDKVNTFLMYGSGTVVDGKKMGLDKTMQKIPVPDIMEEVRGKLAHALVEGKPFIIAMTKSCTDFMSTFTDAVAKESHGLGDGMFLPIEMFDKAGKGLLEDAFMQGIIREAERPSGVAVSKNPDGFYVMLTSQFSPEDYEEFLFGDGYGLPQPKDKYMVLIIQTDAS